MLPLPDDQVDSLFLIFLHALPSPTNVTASLSSHEYRTATNHANKYDTASGHQDQGRYCTVALRSVQRFAWAHRRHVS